jgi:NAD(P)H dehydrogenase (quinone)
MPYAKDFPLAMIDVRDTGAVGARILIDPAPHVGKSYEFTGATTNYGALPTCFRKCWGGRSVISR